jgi:hypothetical protein
MAFTQVALNGQEVAIKKLETKFLPCKLWTKQSSNEIL